MDRAGLAGNGGSSYRNLSAAVSGHTKAGRGKNKGSRPRAEVLPHLHQRGLTGFAMAAHTDLRLEGRPHSVDVSRGIVAVYLIRRINIAL